MCARTGLSPTGKSGAAVNQACAALPYYLHTYPQIVERSWHKLAALGIRPAGRP